MIKFLESLMRQQVDSKAVFQSSPELAGQDMLDLFVDLCLAADPGELVDRVETFVYG